MKRFRLQRVSKDDNRYLVIMRLNYSVPKPPLAHRINRPYKNLLLLIIPLILWASLCHAQSITTTNVASIEKVNDTKQSTNRLCLVTIRFEVVHITQTQVNSLSKDSSYKIKYDPKNKQADIFWVGKMENPCESDDELKKAIEKRPDEFNQRILEKIKYGRVSEKN